MAHRVFTCSILLLGGLSAQINFGNVSTATLATGPNAAAVGDIDGDGDNDVVCGLAGTGGFFNIAVLRNNGSGVMTLFSTFSGGNLPIGMALGDADGDGDLDLYLAGYGNNFVQVLANNGAGLFNGPGFIANLPAGPGIPVIQSLQLANLDNAGRPDVVAVQTTSAGQQIISMIGTPGALTVTGNVAVAAPLTALTLADVTGDGFQDAIVTHASTNEVRVHANLGTGALGGAGGAIPVPGTSLVAVAAGDIDANGTVDLVVTNRIAAPITSTYVVLTNNGSGAFTVGPQTALIPGSSLQNFTYPILRLADVDGDSTLDLVASAGTAIGVVPPGLVVVSNQGGAFGTPLQLFPGGSFNLHGVADLDGDLAPDLTGTFGVSSSTSTVRNLTSQLRLLAPPINGTSPGILFTAPASPGLRYQAALSGGATPGQFLPDGRNVPLNADAIFNLTVVPNPFLVPNIGTLDGQGRAVMTLNIPLDPTLIGQVFFGAGVTIDMTAYITSITAAMRITIQ